MSKLVFVQVLYKQELSLWCNISPVRSKQSDFSARHCLKAEEITLSCRGYVAAAILVFDFFIVT